MLYIPYMDPMGYDYDGCIILSWPNWSHHTVKTTNCAPLGRRLPGITKTPKKQFSLAPFTKITIRIRMKTYSESVKPVISKPPKVTFSMLMHLGYVCFATQLAGSTTGSSVEHLQRYMDLGMNWLIYQSVGYYNNL